MGRGSDILRARILALFLDLAFVAAAIDLPALLATVLIWRFFPAARPALPYLWAAAAAAAVIGFLLRDRSGGTARRLLALEVRREDGGKPGAWRSVARNLPLIVPFWNLSEALPVLRDGEAARPADRRLGLRVARTL
jgi:hypothetical protein